MHPANILFTPYALPAIVALLAKAGIFFYAHYSRVHNLQTRLFLLFLFSLSIQNLAEISFFITNVEGVGTAPFANGTLYFAASILAIALLLHIALVIGTNWRGSGENIPLGGILLVYAPVVVLELLLWLSPLLVSGFQPMNYTITRIPGPLYFLFELFVVSYLCTTFALLVYGMYAQTTAYQRSKNKFLVAGLIPIVVLVILVIGLQHFGFRGFNTTATLPFAITFFLAVTAYTTHQYRLFDIEFFVPWSKFRKRKTAFYTRIQSLIAEIAGMSSVQKIIQSISDALRCPVALVGGPAPSLSMAGEAFGIARFPLNELKKINQIVVANEVVNAMPATHALMKRYNVAAIVPFHPHSQTAASWMLLGEAFSEQVYSPLDFKTVETLFARLADNFLDSQLLLRSQLLEAQREIDTLHARLAGSWDEIDSLRRELADARSEQQTRNPATFGHEGIASALDAEDHYVVARGSLDESATEYEMRLIAKTMDHCGGDVSRAAELLNLPKTTLSKKLQQMAQREAEPAEPQVLFV